jgi:farnesol dehydrogenase
VTGFLGGRVAQALAAAGHDVLGFARVPHQWNDRPAGAQAVEGDITDAASFRAASAGCQAVVHLAGLVRTWTRDSRDFDRANVEGLRHALAAARAADARLVYASSFLALGQTDGGVGDEDSTRPAGPFRNHYERTKWLADQLARALPDGSNDVVRLYPGVVYGPGPMTAGNHVTALLVRHAHGRLPGLLGGGRGRMCLAFVEDVARGFVAALEQAPAGSAYVLGGENRTVRELFDVFAQVSGIAAPRRSIPFWLAAAGGRWLRFRALSTGIEPELTDEVVEIYRHDWAYSSARAERELAYRITPLHEALAETLRWLRATGQIEPRGGRA